MALTSLVVCADATTVQALDRILSNLGMAVEHCSDPAIARTLFASQHFDTVMVDCEREEAAGALISELRLHGSAKNLVVIAILKGGSNPREMFAKGANFILYKPVSDDRLNKSVAAAKTMVRTERRLTQRVPV